MPVPFDSSTRRRNRQANRVPTGSPVFARHGFSLIELLIVIGILTVVTAFVLPNIRGTLDRGRLRAAAVDVQKAWGTARTIAIREGMAMEFRCEKGGRHWKIERAGKLIRVSTADDAGATASGLRADDELNENLMPSEPSGDQQLVREGWLPAGLQFDDLSLRSQTPVSVREFSFDGDEEALPVDLGPQWSEPLRFQSEGRSQDARLRIRGADDFVVSVRIRGLTSAVSFTAPFRQKPSRDEFGSRP